MKFKDYTWYKEFEIKGYFSEIPEDIVNEHALLMSVINSANVLLADHGLYKNFEEAIVVYKQYDLEFYLSNSEEKQKFKDLLNFCFIGRVSVI